MSAEPNLDALGFKAAVAAGREAHRRLDYATSIRCFERAARIERTQYVLTMLAAAHRQMGAKTSAIRLYREAIALPGDGIFATTGLIRVMCLAGEPVQAMQLAADAISRNPDDVALLTTILKGLPEARRAVVELLPDGMAVTAAHLAPIRQLEATLKARLALLKPPPGQADAYGEALYERVADLPPSRVGPVPDSTDPIPPPESPPDGDRADLDGYAVAVPLTRLPRTTPSWAGAPPATA